jgi:hypothetical protein
MSIGRRTSLSDQAACLKISPMPGKRKMGRKPKKASERKSKYIPFLVSKAQLKTYKAAADKGFKGRVSDFIRAACDALAAQLEREPPEVKP